MAKSFWEKMGSSVGRGLEKAKDVGASIGESVGQKLDVGEAKRRMRLAHEELGQVVAQRLGGQDLSQILQRGTIELDPTTDGELRDALESALEARAAYARVKAAGEAPPSGQDPDADSGA